MIAILVFAILVCVGGIGEGGGATYCTGVEYAVVRMDCSVL